ncbi:hypothetical protein [Halarcobacter ebronensis]|uniref:Uncharacterized protein n=1 Tax=Halarcobacter ebronensis TaxID=1462615 RepID=A0A4Q1B0J6_9BACT|nr:hypothetical protein [Halarcobacter ebronensis]QKF80740.1 hypothetical protein AEBR_0224 [Halarcobacter ebronensis]RXK08533.1 hypothetical protein CRV07_01665 [Halarcobacter ebronensis]
MLRVLFLSIFLLQFSGCFSSINPFSDSTENGLKQIEIPDDAPLWLEEPNKDGTIYAMGISKILKNEDEKILKRKALIIAGNNLSRKIYVKTLAIYKEYLEKTKESSIFENDLKKAAKQVAISSMKASKIDGFWKDSENLYTQIRVDYSKVASELQYESKQLFKVDVNLYENILSNRAYEELLKVLED